MLIASTKNQSVEGVIGGIFWPVTPIASFATKQIDPHCKRPPRLAAAEIAKL